MQSVPAAARRSLDPYPSGWYVLAFARELPPGGVLTRWLGGRELVLFRTASGRIGAIDAYCPHLGGHLGRGGRVEGETLRCPFHGFRFDGGGRCVATGYDSKPPPNASTRSVEVREVNEMLLAYHDVDGRPPTWEVPPVDARDWSRPYFRRFELEAHPQETTENSVDLGHFAHVHGYRDVRMLRDVIVDGPYLSTSYAAFRPMPLIGRWVEFDFQFETRIHGLGYSMVEVTVRGFDIRARLWVLPSPIDGERIQLYLAASGSGRDDVHRLLRLLPARLRANAVGIGLLVALAYDAQQDFDIWQHKRYVHPPALALGDGPIGKYRTWAAQFYAQPAARSVATR
ncbi:MAG: Rieske 2Fe-2S domain-containing protein [Deltaproteobacteria bacterium]|nr:Rieske 2Fe-2S domain-containing protein [Deltaproteobacteria bacterium]